MSAASCERFFSKLKLIKELFAFYHQTVKAFRFCDIINWVCDRHRFPRSIRSFEIHERKVPIGQDGHLAKLLRWSL